MDIEKIKKSKTKYIGKNIIFYNEIDSTQEEAKRKLNKLSNGTIIIADKQTKGRGTKCKKWYTNSGNIAMTIILKPRCKMEKISNLTIKIAEIMVEVICKIYKCQLEIKKPNDILLNNKKICGILTESKTIGDNVESILIGIGLNVNETKFNKELEKIATSLKKELKKELNREEIIVEFIEMFEKELELQQIN